MVFAFIKRMSRERREYVRSRLAILYAIVSWNSCAYVFYIFHKEHTAGANLPKGLEYGAMTKGVEKANVIRMDGFNIVENTFYTKEELDDARHKIETAKIIDDTNDF